MRSRWILLALCLALLTGPQVTAAEEEPAPPEESLAPETESEATESPPEPDPPGYAEEGGTLLHGRLELTLENAIKMGLENNLDVQVERYSPLIAQMEKKIAWGAYDPKLIAEFGYSDAKTPSASAFAGGAPRIGERKRDGKAGLRGILPLLGTEYEATFDGARTTTDFPVATLSPEFTSGWSVSVTQPILKDLIWNQPWLQVRTSRLALEGSEHAFRRSVMDTVRDIEQAYWQLVADGDERRVSEKSLETASALLDQTRTQYEVGVVSKVEVTEAQAGLSSREFNLIQVENEYRNQQDVLIDLVMGRGLRSASTLELVPTDRPEEFVEYDVDVETAVAGAFENRPELVEARKRVETQEVQLAFERNQWLPDLDGVLRLGQSGLSGRPNPDAGGGFGGGPAPGVTGGFGHSFNEYEDNPAYSARAVMSVPFPNTSATGKVRKTRFALQQERTKLAQQEQAIIIEVREAARNLDASQKGIVAARDAELAAEEQLRAERIRLEYGESTPFDVLQREEQLVDRENELIEAFRGYRSSVTALDRARGTILRNRNIRIDTVGALR